MVISARSPFALDRKKQVTFLRYSDANNASETEGTDVT